MKKLIGIFTALLLTPCCVLPVSALAAGESFALSLKFDKESYEVGDTVTATLMLDRTDSDESYYIYSFEGGVLYKPLYLEYTTCTQSAESFRIGISGSYYNEIYEYVSVVYHSMGNPTAVSRSASLVLAEFQFTAKAPIRSGTLPYYAPKLRVGTAGAVATLVTNDGKYTINSPVPLYAVSFAGGTNAVGNAPNAAIPEEAAEGYQFTLPQNSYTLENARFAGWSDGKKVYQPGDTYTMPGQAVTFTAQWSHLRSITFTAGKQESGVTVTGEGPAARSLYPGETLAMPTRGTLVRSGHSFEGWSFNGKNYKPGDIFTMPDKDVVFSALWKSEATGEVIGGTTGSGSTQVSFTDVQKDAFYYDAVLWAVEKGVTAGTSDTTFSPAQTCTRAQTVTFLWRAMGEPEPKTTNNPFTDVATNAYYYKAVLWAVEKGVTNGTSDTTFSPDATVTRGQAVTFQWRAAGGTKSGATNPFSDVSTGAFYYDAVLWAVEHQVTQGTSATGFSPDSGCTRGQIVTFLYRHLNG